MRLLLDTHALIWWLAGDPSLSADAKAAMIDPENEVFVSAASAWEIATKYRIGRLTQAAALARDVPGLPPPVRQYTVYDEHGEFVARVDLCWPELGLFIELDGQHHPGQPVYDARRETAVVAATGWLPPSAKRWTTATSGM